MPRPTSGVTMGLEGVAEGEVDDFSGLACGGVDRDLRGVEGGGNWFEVVEFAGYGEGFVIFGVDGFGEGIAGRVFDEEVKEFCGELRDKTPRAHGLHLSRGAGVKKLSNSFKSRRTGRCPDPVIMIGKVPWPFPHPTYVPSSTRFDNSSETLKYWSIGRIHDVLIAAKPTGFIRNIEKSFPMTDSASPLSYSIPLSRLLARLEGSLGDQEKLKSLNEVELRKAAAVDNAPCLS